MALRGSFLQICTLRCNVINDFSHFDWNLFSLFDFSLRPSSTRMPDLGSSLGF